MTNHPTLRKLLYPSLPAMIAAWALPIAAVLLAIAAFIIPALYSPQPEPFSTSTPPGSFCQAPIARIEQHGTDDEEPAEYFAAQNTDGTRLIIKLDAQGRERFAQHIAYKVIYSTLPPEPIASEGMSAAIDEETAERLAASLGFENASALREIYGSSLLDATAQPQSGAQAGCWLAAILLLAVWLMSGINCFLRVREAKRWLARLEKRGKLDAAESELTGENVKRPGKGRVLLSESFIALPSSGAVMEYADLAWCYTQRSGYSSSLCIRTLYDKEYTLSRSEEDNKKLLSLLRERCGEELLEGFTMQNLALFEQRVKDSKTRRSDPKNQ